MQPAKAVGGVEDSGVGIGDFRVEPHQVGGDIAAAPLFFDGIVRVTRPPFSSKRPIVLKGHLRTAASRNVHWL